MVNHLSSSGTAAIVSFPGTLYRVNKSEKLIRKYLVENINILDTVIQLPTNLFFGTEISTCIIVLRKNKKDTGVFFINAQDEFVKETKTNKLTQKNIDKIVDAVRNKNDVDNFSHYVSLEEIKANDFNLSVNLYVSSDDEKEHININDLNSKLKEVAKNINDLRVRIDEIVEMLEGREDE